MPDNEKKEEDHWFDLDRIIFDAPVLRGWFLSLVSTLMGLPVIGSLMQMPISKRNLTPIGSADIEGDPMFYPILPPPAETFASDDVESKKFQESTLAGNSSEVYLTINDYYEAFRSHKYSPLDVVERIRKQIEKSDEDKPPLRCFTQLDWEATIKAAEESTGRYRTNTPLSVLDGIPVGVKDELNVRGFRTNCGRLVKEDVNEEDCLIAYALKSYGAIIIGITNMHEMGMGVTGINPFHGAVRNPHNDKHVTGGSSSGSAAAVSAGIVPIAIGTDGGGSVRIPSSYCGVAGIKGTFGRFSNTGTVILGGSTCSAGLIANNVTDLALVSSMISTRAADPRYFAPGTYHPLRLTSDTAEAQLRVATIPEPYLKYCHEEVRKAYEKSLGRLTCSTKKSVQFRELYLSKIAHMGIILSETASDRSVLDKHGSTLSPQTKIVYAVTSQLDVSYYFKCSRQKARAVEMFKEIFESYDVIISPTCANLPKVISEGSCSVGEMDESDMLMAMWFVFLANLCGLPAITVNVGYSEPDGLPIGVMVMAPWWREDLVFQVARLLETAPRKPSRFYGDNLSGESNDVSLSYSSRSHDKLIDREEEPSAKKPRVTA